MRKIAPSYYCREFRPLLIDRKLVNEILEILTRQAESVGTMFLGEEYQYESLREVDESPGVKIRQIKITTREPYSTLVLGKRQRSYSFLLKDENSLYVHGEEGAALFALTCQAIVGHQRVLSLFFTWWVFFAFVMLNLSTMYVPWHSFLNAHFGSNAAAVAIWSSVAYEYAFVYLALRGMSTLRLAVVPQSFWTRNRDKIGLLIIGAVIGIAATVVGQYLVHLLVR